MKKHSQFHLSMDMLEVAHAKKAQSLASEQDYRLTLHQYTSLPDDMKVLEAKRAYQLQSEVGMATPEFRGQVQGAGE